MTSEPPPASLRFTGTGWGLSALRILTVRCRHGGIDSGPVYSAVARDIAKNTSPLPDRARDSTRAMSIESNVSAWSRFNVVDSAAANTLAERTVSKARSTNIADSIGLGVRVSIGFDSNDHSSGLNHKAIAESPLGAPTELQIGFARLVEPLIDAQ